MSARCTGQTGRRWGGRAAQLLNEYSPIAAGMLAVLVPTFEPMGWRTREAGTLLGFEYTWPAIVAIAISAILGLLVSLSTFLVRAAMRLARAPGAPTPLCPALA
jgi:solute carrier family 35 protein E3